MLQKVKSVTKSKKTGVFLFQLGDTEEELTEINDKSDMAPVIGIFILKLIYFT